MEALGLSLARLRPLPGATWLIVHSGAVYVVSRVTILIIVAPTKPRNQAPPERELMSGSSYLWRGGRDSKAQLPAVSPRKRRGRDP
jgi:hypothetical protein